MKILIIPDKQSQYDYNMVRNFAAGFDEIGCSAVALGKNALGEDLTRAQEVHGSELIIHINTLLTPTQKIGRAKYISWIQDYFPSQRENYLNHDRERSKILAMGSASSLGLPDIGTTVGPLNVGVSIDSSWRRSDGRTRKWDVGLLGFIPPKNVILSPNRLPLELRYLLHTLLYHILPREMRLGRSLGTLVDWLTTADKGLPNIFRDFFLTFVESNYKPLTGTLDVNKFYSELKKILDKYYPLYSPVKGDLDFIVQTYPRYLDRHLLGELLTKTHRDINIWGKGWSTYAEFTRAYRGILNQRSQVLEVLGNMNTIFCNNTHGVFIHPTVLDAIAQGTFVFWHRTSHTSDITPSRVDALFGGFEPGRHFGLYQPYDINNALELWTTSEMRNSANEAREILLDRHLWRHRAKQVLDMLDRW
jgi:hypothetical protein